MAVTRYVPNLMREHCQLSITQEMYRQLKRFKIMFENRPDHPLTLNGQLIGVYRFIFTPADVTEVMNIFGIDLRELEAQQKAIQNPPLKDSPFRRTFNVANDCFSIVVIWILHITKNKNYRHQLSAKELDDFRLDLASIWIYKHFGSKITRAWPYGANREIMEATMNGDNALSKKYSIIKLGNWYNVFKYIAEDLLSNDNVHANTFLNFDDDKKIIYILNNVNTRCKDIVININIAFHKNKELGAKLSSTQSTLEIDGEKLIRKQQAGYDVMILGLQKEIVNLTKWINDQSIDQTLSMFKIIRKDAFKHVLVAMSKEAAIQRQKKEDTKEIMTKEGKVFVGLNLLIAKIIQIAYRHSIQARVNMNSPLDILQHTKNVVSSSRSLDEDIEALKRSVSILLDKHTPLRHVATLSAMRIAIIVYVVIRSFRYIQK